MGGKSSRPRGPSAADTRKQMEGYWRNVQTWRNDINQRYSRLMATTRTRMAAGGIKSGTEAWNNQLKSLEQGRTKALRDIETGATYKQLSEWASKQQRTQRQQQQRAAAPASAPVGFDTGSDFIERPRPAGYDPSNVGFGTGSDFTERPRPAGYDPSNVGFGTGSDFIERSTRRTAQPQSGELSPLLGVDEYLEQQFGTFSGTSSARVSRDTAGERRAAASGAGQRRSPWWG